MHAIEKEKHIKLNLNVLSILDSQKAAVSLISETNSEGSRMDWHFFCLSFLFFFFKGPENE